ncbi:hypothetical protein [Glutamicibacter sp. X7]
MRRAERIRARAERRMWLGYLPAMVLMLIVTILTAAMPTGVSTLMMLLSGGLALGAWCDLAHAEAMANAADRADLTAA